MRHPTSIVCREGERRIALPFRVIAAAAAAAAVLAWQKKEATAQSQRVLARRFRWLDKSLQGASLASASP